MIKHIVRVITLPFQSISDAIRRNQNRKKMMNHYLGIRPNQFDLLPKEAHDYCK